MSRGLIIPYQELSGNYNTANRATSGVLIIPYQELSGNYNMTEESFLRTRIIPYQEPSDKYQTSVTKKQTSAEWRRFVLGTP